MLLFFVGLLGLEPRLFWTKTRRVASYTIDQCIIAGANLKLSFWSANIFFENLSFKNHFVQKSTHSIGQKYKHVLSVC